jgi:hypothetical protein
MRPAKAHSLTAILALGLVLAMVVGVALQRGQPREGS